MPQEALTYEKDYIQHVHLDYLRYLPKRYGINPGQKWPLILFLHGAGERGSDLDFIRRHGIPKVAEEMDLQFVALSPQCPADHWWSDFLPALDDLLTFTITTFDIDPDRIYLTGLSMGGFGTWHLAAEHPERFAAIAPICGGGPWQYGFPERVCSLKNIPTWVFHGEKDPVVPVEASKSMVDALTACGGNVRLTVYPACGHDSWSQTYDNPELYQWFLEHQRGTGSGG